MSERRFYSPTARGPEKWVPVFGKGHAPPNIVAKLTELRRQARLMAWLTSACLLVAVVDGWWPAAVVTVVDAVVLAGIARRVAATADRASEIAHTRAAIAREVGTIMAALQAAGRCLPARIGWRRRAA